eukprot:sb/3476986/
MIGKRDPVGDTLRVSPFTVEVTNGWFPVQFIAYRVHQGGCLVGRESIRQADRVHSVQFLFHMLGRAESVGTSSKGLDDGAASRGWGRGVVFQVEVAYLVRELLVGPVQLNTL